MKKSGNFLAAAVLAVILTGIAACGSESAGGASGLANDAEKNAAADEGTAAETEAVPVFTEKNYGGRDYTVYLWTSSQIAVEEETGDIISDANYRRNHLVQELFNLKFRYEVSDGGGEAYTQWLGNVQNSIRAGDDAYQLVGGYTYRLAMDTLDNGFVNLRETEIDFEKSWWPSTISGASDIGGNLYLVCGNIDTSYYDNTYALCFNKKLEQEYNMDSFYALVDSGKWTLDKLIECAKIASNDLDGNSVMNENDRYGYLTDKYMCIDGYIQACDVPITKNTAESLPELLGMTDKYAAVQVKVRDFVRDSSITLYGNVNTNREIFQSGNGLILAQSILGVHRLRDMEDEFGIIPYPKWDEAQERYYTHNSICNVTSYCIPSTADAELSAGVIDALSYYGYRDVLPEYYERALKGKVSRDNESEAMLDIIFGNVLIDFTEVYSFCFGDQQAPSMLLRASIEGNRDIASMYQSFEQMYDATMEDIFEKLGAE